MRTGRPKQPLGLDPADKEKLTLLARRPKTAQRVAVRSKIVLRAAEGLSNQAIALQFGRNRRDGGQMAGALPGAGHEGFGG